MHLNLFWIAALLLTILSLMLALFFQPRYLLAMTTWIVPGVRYFAKTDRPVIALTIDDGPDARTTPKILDVLRRYGSRATFFVISSRIQGNEELIKTLLRDGHELGNHLTEDKPSIQLSPQAFTAELLEAHHVLAHFSQPRWLRPAGGWYNRAMVNISHQQGYQVVLGSIFPFDTHISSAWFSSIQILLNARPGSIVVLHDNDLRGERTVATLEKILPELSRKGYKIVTLSDLFAS
jgi:peptidoglycan/xylan/chitin deacetylase (PgdA/CDA1 family)